jgi:hypothetical protein
MDSFKLGPLVPLDSTLRATVDVLDTSRQSSWISLGVPLESVSEEQSPDAVSPSMSTAVRESSSSSFAA